MEVKNKVIRIVPLLSAFQCEKKYQSKIMSVFAKIFKNIRARESTGIDFSPEQKFLT